MSAFLEKEELNQVIFCIIHHIMKLWALYCDEYHSLLCLTSFSVMMVAITVSYIT